MLFDSRDSSLLDGLGRACIFRLMVFFADLWVKDRTLMYFNLLIVAFARTG